MHSFDWRNIQSYTLGAWLLAVSTTIAAIVGFGFLLHIVSNITEVFAADNPFGPIAAMIFVVPFAILTILNAALLQGVLRKNMTAFIAAAVILPVEWMTGLVLGGNAISSGLFNGKQYLSSFPYHHQLQILVFILFASLSFYVYGREYRDARLQKKIGHQ
jgi:hypothetical protein